MSLFRFEMMDVDKQLCLHFSCSKSVHAVSASGNLGWQRAEFQERGIEPDRVLEWPL